jgi:subtilase family serine protease
MKAHYIRRLTVFATCVGLALGAAAQPIQLQAPPDFVPGRGGRTPLPTIDPSRIVTPTRPDLTITLATISRGNIVSNVRGNKVSYCVRNNGGTTSGATSVLFANTDSGDSGYPPWLAAYSHEERRSYGAFFGSVPALNPGQETCNNFAFKTKGATRNAPSFFSAATRARLIVDRFNLVAESNETNNEMATTIVSDTP